LQAIEEAGFGNVKNATELVLSSGEILYIPSFWFHYIVSQDASIQCNARSGSSSKGSEGISKCLNKKAKSNGQAGSKAAMSDLLLMELQI
jgi:ribosomal protein L16 Arg81 hydroxylase